MSKQPDEYERDIQDTLRQVIGTHHELVDLVDQEWTNRAPQTVKEKRVKWTLTKMVAASAEACLCAQQVLKDLDDTYR